MVQREPAGAIGRGREVLISAVTGRRVLPPAPRRDVLVVSGALVVLSALAWLYVARWAGDGMTAGLLGSSSDGTMSDEGMSGMAGMADEAGGSSGMALTAFLLTWVVMMVAMMFPAASPVVLLFDRWRRQRRAPVHLTVAFVLGYLAVWSTAGLAAYAAVLGVDAQLGAGVSDTAVRIGGATLLAAGVYQLSPIKRICLTACRSPMGFLITHPPRLDRGALGPLATGVRHGAFCLGCCWALMAVLVVLGVMHVGWMAAVSALILLEKVVPYGPVVGKVAGIGLVGVGVLVAATGATL